MCSERAVLWARETLRGARQTSAGWNPQNRIREETSVSLAIHSSDSYKRREPFPSKARLEQDAAAPLERGERVLLHKVI